MTLQLLSRSKSILSHSGRPSNIPYTTPITITGTGSVQNAMTVNNMKSGCGDRDPVPGIRLNSHECQSVISQR